MVYHLVIATEKIHQQLAEMIIYINIMYITKKTEISENVFKELLI